MTTSRTGSAPTPTCAAGSTVRGPVAIFDLDRTILPGSSLSILARALVARGLLPRRMLAEVAARNLRFRRRGEGASPVGTFVADVLALAEGMALIDLQLIMDGLRADLVRASRPQLRRRILQHRADGFHCVVLTASPVELAMLVADGLGAHAGIGTRAEIVDGRFTGRLAGPVCHGPGKLSALEAGGVRPAWEQSWAYSDSVSDLPVLRAVANPVAVNPDRGLRRVAVARRWEILELSGR